MATKFVKMSEYRELSRTLDKALLLLKKKDLKIRELQTQLELARPLTRADLLPGEDWGAMCERLGRNH